MARSAASTGAELPAKEYVGTLKKFDGFSDALARLKVGEDQGVIASAMEFVLEGLHLNRRLNRDKVDGGFRYRG